MVMKNPPHVGEILRELYLEPMGISVTEAAEKLGVTRQALSRLINEKSGISAEMAIRLSQVFGASVEFWVNLQKHYEIADALERCKHIKLKQYKSRRSGWTEGAQGRA